MFTSQTFIDMLVQGRPFREGIRENSALYWGLVGASGVAFSGATDFIPELNRWLQVVEMDFSVSHRFFERLISADPLQFKLRLTASMIIDFIGCWVIENVCKYLFADLEPKSIVTRGRERRERRRAAELLTQDRQGDNEKKTQ
jgi:manganese-transporting P-type ATPase